MLTLFVFFVVSLRFFDDYDCLAGHLQTIGSDLHLPFPICVRCVFTVFLLHLPQFVFDIFRSDSTTALQHDTVQRQPEAAAGAAAGSTGAAAAGCVTSCVGVGAVMSGRDDASNGCRWSRSRCRC